MRRGDGTTGPRGAPDLAAPLIGADDVRAPYWAEGFVEVAGAGLRDVARHPRTPPASSGGRGRPRHGSRCSPCPSSCSRGAPPRSGCSRPLITARDDAAEVRAFTTQDVLLAEHRRIARDPTVEQVGVEHRKNRTVLVGRAG